MTGPHPGKLDEADPDIPAIGKDGTLYPIGKMEAHRRGVLHLAISVFVFAGDSLLIQRRASGKYHSGGQWANTCCSHPLWDEAPAVCAARRLEEELGFVVPLRPAGIVQYDADVGNGLREHERVYMFRGGVAERDEITIAPDPREVSEIRWTDVATLRRAVARTPEDFTPWLRIYLARGAEALVA